jgi:hypothetical protein
VLAVATLAAIVAGNQIVEQRNATHAAGLVHALLNAETAQVPVLIADMVEYRSWTDALLRQKNESATELSPQKLHTSLALLPVDRSQMDYLYGRLLDAQAHEDPVIRDALAPYQQELVNKLWSTAEQPGEGPALKRADGCGRRMPWRAMIQKAPGGTRFAARLWTNSWLRTW